MWADITWPLFQSFPSHNFYSIIASLHFVHRLCNTRYRMWIFYSNDKIWLVTQQSNVSHHYINQCLISAKAVPIVSLNIRLYNKRCFMSFSWCPCLVGLFYPLLINKSLSLYYRTIAWFVLWLLLYQDCLFKVLFLPDTWQEEKWFIST